MCAENFDTKYMSLDTPAFGKIALVAVGVQQVSSVRWNSSLSLEEGRGEVLQGTELGCFLFGGSDIVLFFEPGKAPHITPKIVKVGYIIA